jgi:hypothetical protein
MEISGVVLSVFGIEKEWKMYEEIFRFHKNDIFEMI